LLRCETKLADLDLAYAMLFAVLVKIKEDVHGRKLEPIVPIVGQQKGFIFRASR